MNDLPLAVLRQETAVGQLLAAIQSSNLFKVIAVEGDIDFDLLGLMLSFDVRFCSEQTVFENHIVERGVVPGFGIVWYLTRYLGIAAAVDLMLNCRRLTADEALRFRLVTRLSKRESPLMTQPSTRVKSRPIRPLY